MRKKGGEKRRFNFNLMTDVEENDGQGRTWMATFVGGSLFYWVL